MSRRRDGRVRTQQMGDDLLMMGLLVVVLGPVAAWMGLVLFSAAGGVLGPSLVAIGVWLYFRPNRFTWYSNPTSSFGAPWAGAAHMNDRQVSVDGWPAWADQTGHVTLADGTQGTVRTDWYGSPFVEHEDGTRSSTYHDSSSDWVE